MASEEATCVSCGAPLVGTDRFEGKCAACREKEILGEPPPAEGEPPELPRTVGCPACGATTPEGSTTCSECGAALEARRARGPLLAALCIAGAVVVTTIVVLIRTWGGGQPTPAATTEESQTPQADAEEPRPSQEPAPTEPEPAPVPPSRPGVTSARPAKPAPPPGSPSPHAEQVAADTLEVIKLLRAGDCGKVVDNYCLPGADFRKLEGELGRFIGDTSPSGFERWTGYVRRANPPEAVALLRTIRVRHPEYALAMLRHLASSSGSATRRATTQDQAFDLLKWHITERFKDVVWTTAKAGAVTEAVPGSPAADVTYSGARTQPREGETTIRIHWQVTDEGRVLETALASYFAELAAILRKHSPPKKPPGKKPPGL